jgi:hypothetical protein
MHRLFSNLVDAPAVIKSRNYMESGPQACQLGGAEHLRSFQNREELEQLGALRATCAGHFNVDHLIYLLRGIHQKRGRYFFRSTQVSV